MLNIDEAIEREKQKAKEQRSHIGTFDEEYSKKCEMWAEEHEQLAEWLEELKELRKIKEDYAKGMQTSYATFMYNKAIDDMKSIVKNHNNTEKVSMVKLMNGKHNYYRAISVSKFCRLADRLKVGDHNA